MIAHGNRMIANMGAVQSIYRKDDSGVPHQGAAILVADGNGGVKKAQMIFASTGPVVGIVFCDLALEAKEYRLSGTVTPVGKVARVSMVTDDSAVDTVAMLRDNIVATAESDSDGNFVIDSLQGWDGSAIVWAEIAANMLEGSASNITCTAIDTEGGTSSGGSGSESGGGTEGGGGSSGTDMPTEERAYTISTAFSAEPNIVNGATYFHFDAAVSGPSDLSNAMLYAIDPDTGDETPISVDFTGGDGSWEARASFDRSGTPYTDFRMVGTTDDEAGEIVVEVSRYEATCLSGDTLITIADGTDKRLDALTEADIVLGGDGMPAKILRLARGRWNPYHTLYRFADGTIIDEVHEHRFYNCEQGFWQKLKNWRIGEHARRIDGGAAALVDVQRIEERKEMFGLWVERDSYWANGLLSGDAKANLPLLENATAEQAADMAASLNEKALLKVMGLEDMMP